MGIYHPDWSAVDSLATKVLQDFMQTVTMDVTINIDELQTKLDEAQAELAELLEVDDDELETEDEQRFEELEKIINRLNKRISAAKLVQEGTSNRRSRGRRVPEPSNDPQPRQRRGETVPAQARNSEEDRRHGFRFFGEFAETVLNACRGSSSPNGASAIERMHNAATTYGSESSGPDGGFLVPPEFSENIWQKVRAEESLLSRTSPFVTGKNSLTFPKDETTPWDNSAGIRVFWEGEGEQGTEAKPKFETTTARLNKLMALIKVTEELYDDAPGLDSYLRFWTPIKMVSRINTAIVRGTGVGMPLGILNSASLLTISKETSQDAASILMPNITNLWNRMYAPLRQNAVWLINQEIEPQLLGMQFIPANEHGTYTGASVQPVYMPPGGLSASPYGTLLGRPVIPIQPCSQLGTAGDIIFVALDQYMNLTKGSGIQSDVSMHLHFDQAIETFRFIFRVTGQPLWNNVIAAENGSNTYSWAVTIEARA